METRRQGVRAVAVVAALALALAPACGDGDGDGDGDERSGEAGSGGVGGGEPVGTSTASSPFTVTRPPAGYRLVQAGRGTVPQTWSSDSFGDDEPVTVLARPGADPAGPEVVRVSLTGFEGFEGGLAQASRGYTSEATEHFELDGSPAIYTPARPDEDKPADLVVVAGDDLAVRVRAQDATRDELVAIAREVHPREDHLLAPAVPDPPGDLEVLGWADADLALTLATSPTPSSASLPAGERAHTAVWARGAPGTAWTPEGGTVAVSTLPGQAADLDAVAASLHRHGHLGEPQVTSRAVDGRPGVVLETPGNPEADGYGALRAVVTSTAGGDLLVVVARGAERPPADELVAVAASVEPAGPEEWEATVLEAQGGPGLHPDDGAVELARGTAGDIEWLLQSRVDDGTVDDGLVTSFEPDTTGQYVVDPCLKLAGGERVCATATSESSGPGRGVTINTARPGEAATGVPDFPGFVLVSTELPAATMRVHTADGPVDVPLVTLPGGARRAGVLVTDADVGGLQGCGTDTHPGTVTLLDAAGNPLAC
ncbi:MAG TPA: hypothetical protein VIL36_17120 [Acidimicrobiales bacterium]